ncbi:hypothetical protein FB451DRAFT_1262443 [Mycena latifolia]|nr:hypothetical protein FB451DRAFT_1262443 [Mycena latifolia]
MMDRNRSARHDGMRLRTQECLGVASLGRAFSEPDAEQPLQLRHLSFVVFYLLPSFWRQHLRWILRSWRKCGARVPIERGRRGRVFSRGRGGRRCGLAGCGFALRLLLLRRNGGAGGEIAAHPVLRLECRERGRVVLLRRAVGGSERGGRRNRVGHGMYRERGGRLRGCQRGVYACHSGRAAGFDLGVGNLWTARLTGWPVH